MIFLSFVMLYFYTRSHKFSHCRNYFKLSCSKTLTFVSDWGSLVVGKVSPWLQMDSDVLSIRRNSELVIQY